MKKYLVSEFQKIIGDDVWSGEYLKKEMGKAFGAEEGEAAAKFAKKYNLTVGQRLMDIDRVVSSHGGRLIIQEKRDGIFELGIEPAFDDITPEEKKALDKALEAYDNSFLKFSLPKDGLIAHNGQEAYNGKVQRYIENHAFRITSLEQTLDETYKKFLHPSKDFTDRLNKMREEKTAEAFKHAMQSIRTTVRKSTSGMSSAGNSDFGELVERTRQGTGTAENRALRESFVGFSAMIKDIVGAYGDETFKSLRRALEKQSGHKYTPQAAEKRFGDDIMGLIAMTADNTEKQIVEMLRNTKNNPYQYLFTGGLRNVLLSSSGNSGLLDAMNKKHLYIGTAQESMIGRRIGSFVKNEQLVPMGHLIGEEARKAPQTFNHLNFHNVQQKAKDARKKYSKEMRFTTDFLKNKGIGRGEDEKSNYELRQFGALYFTDKEILAAQNRAIESYIKEMEKGAGGKATKGQLKKWEAEARAKVGAFGGAHSGGAFYLDEAEDAFDATMNRNATLSKRDIDEVLTRLSAYEIAKAGELAGRVKGESEEDRLKRVEKAKMAFAVKRLIRKKTRSDDGIIFNGGKNWLKEFSETIDAGPDENGQYRFNYDWARHMESGRKLLLTQLGERLTTTKGDAAFFTELLNTDERAKSQGWVWNGQGNKDEERRKWAAKQVASGNFSIAIQAEKLSDRNVGFFVAANASALMNNLFALDPTGGIAKAFAEKMNSMPGLKGWLDTSDWQNSIAQITKYTDKSDTARRKTLTGFVDGYNEFIKNDLPKLISGEALDPEQQELLDSVKSMEGTFFFDYDKNGKRKPGLNMNIYKYRAATTANQFNEYEYGEPGDTFKADYRYAGANERAIMLGSLVSGESLSTLQKFEKIKREGTPENVERLGKLKALQDDFERVKDETLKSSFSGHKIPEGGIVLGYDPTEDGKYGKATEGRNKITLDEEGNLIFARTGEKLEDLAEKKDIGDLLQNAYFDVGSENLKRLDGGAYLKGDDSGYVDLSQAKGSLPYVLAQLSRWKKSGQNFYLAPGSGAFAMRDAKSNKEITGTLLALGALSEGDFFEEGDHSKFRIPEFVRNATYAVTQGRDFRKAAADPNSTDMDLYRMQAEESKSLVNVAAAYRDSFENKNSALYDELHKTLVPNSATPRAQASSVGFEEAYGNDEFMNGLLLTAGLMNDNDVKRLLRGEYNPYAHDENGERINEEFVGKDGKKHTRPKMDDEAIAKYDETLRLNLQYMYGDDYMKRFKAYMKKKNPKFSMKDRASSDKLNRLLEEFAVESVNIESDVFKQRRKEAEQSGTPLRGLVASYVRNPLSNGLDEKFAELFAATDRIQKSGTIRTGLGLSKSFNGDFDGDHYNIMLKLADKEALKVFGATGASSKELVDQYRTMIDAQKRVSAIIGAAEAASLIGKDEKLVGANGVMRLGAKDFKNLFNKNLQDKAARASRINKAAVGSLSYDYQAVTEAMFGEMGKTPNLDPGSLAQKEEMVQQAAIRAIFESFTQDAISSKKVSERLGKLKGKDAENYLSSNEFLNDVTNLQTLWRRKSTYTDRAAFDKAVGYAQKMGLLGGGKKGKSVFDDRIGLQVIAWAQEMATENGKVDYKKFGDMVGWDEKTAEKNKIEYEMKNGVLSLSDAQVKKLLAEDLPGISVDALWNIISKYTGKHEDVIWKALNFGRSKLEGASSAQRDPFSSLGHLSDGRMNGEYDDLVREIVGVTDGYGDISKAAVKATEAVRAEAAAEQAKIGIANKEGKAMKGLAREYDGTADSVLNLNEALEDYVKIGDDAMRPKAVTKLAEQVGSKTGYAFADASGFQKALDDQISLLRQQYGEGTKEFNEALRKLSSDPEAMKMMGFDQRTREEFAEKVWFSNKGVIADSIEQLLGNAVRDGIRVLDDDGSEREIRDFSDLIRAHNQFRSGRGRDDKKLQAFWAQAWAEGTPGGKKAGAMREYQDASLRMLAAYGYDPELAQRKLSEAHGYGELMFHGTYRGLAGGLAERIGGAEVPLIAVLGESNVLHGRADRITYGKKQFITPDPITGEASLALKDTINVTDKKAIAGAPTTSYMVQVFSYIRALEQLRDEIKKYDFDSVDQLMNGKESNLGKLYKKEFEKTGLKLDDELFMRLKRGDAIEGGFTVANERGLQTYRLGHTKFTPDGASYMSLTGDRDTDRRLIEKINSGENIMDWDEGLKQAFGRAAYQVTDPNQTVTIDQQTGKKRTPEEEAANNFKEAWARIIFNLNNKTNLEKRLFDAEMSENDKWKESVQKQLDETNANLADAQKDYLVLAKRENVDLARKSMSKADQDLYLPGGSGSVAETAEEVAGQARTKIEERARAEKGIIGEHQAAYYRKIDRQNQREAIQAYARKYSLMLERRKAADRLEKNKDPNLMGPLNNLIEDIDSQLGDTEDDILLKKRNWGSSIAEAAEKRAEANYKLKLDKYLTRGQNASSAARGNGFLGINAQIIRWVDRLMMGGAFQKFLQLVKTGMGQMVQKAKELDAAMTNLRIVTGDSASDAKNMMSQYSKLAKELGSTTTEVTNAATEWLRQGYETAEVTDLITASMYLSKLGMIDSTTATKDLTIQLPCAAQISR